VLSELARARPSQAPTAPELGAAAALPVGDRIDRYVLLREIGAGGMGTVYAAHDPTLDRKVAVKLLRRSGSAESRSRLVREAQAMARVSSPNVVMVHDAGTFGDQVYIAMELVEGGTLTAWSRERTHGWREVVRVFELAGRGLAAAHERGLVHRDFKPDNVLIDGDRVRVADFGLAAVTEGHVTADRRSEQLELTTTGALVGTPAYMAPEQFSGEPADARSDQFSFCVAFYEALFAIRPFAGATIDKLAAEVRAGRVRAMPRGAPAWLRAVVMRGLATDRDARFPSMTALLAQLARGRTRRRAFVFAAAATAIAGASAGGVMVLSGGASDPCASAAIVAAPDYDASAIRARFEAVRPGAGAIADRAFARIASSRDDAAALRGASCRASRLEGTESETLSDLRMECVARSEQEVAALVRVMREPTPPLIDGLLLAVDRAIDLTPCSAPRALLEPLREPNEPAARGRWRALRERLGDARAADAAGRFDTASSGARVVAEAARLEGARAIESEAWQVLGQARDNDHDYIAAREAFQRALVAAEAAGDSRQRARLYLVLANAENKLDRRSDAVRWIAQARALIDHLAIPELASEITYHEGLAAVWVDDFATALPKLRAALAEHERGGREDVRTIQLLETLGFALWQRNESSEAERVLRRAITLGERLLGERHPTLIDPLTTLGSIAIGLGRPNDAEQDLRRAFTVAEASTGERGTLIARPAALLGALLAQTGHAEEGIGYLDRALAASKPAVGDDSGQYATLLSIRSQFLTDLGRGEAALADQARAVEITRKRFGPDGLELAQALEGLGRTLQGLERFDDSVASYEEARAIRTRSPHGDKTKLYYDEQGIGFALLNSGRQARSIPYLERALALRPAGDDNDPSERADVQLAIARALLELGRHRARALALLRDARETYRRVEGGAAKVEVVTQTLAELGAK
jgi:tetratricopeptide (TPR) repeat protein